MSTSPAVFVSYAHEDAVHEDRVRRLVDALRADGVTAVLDQYVENPQEGWPRWMTHHIRESDYVLVVASKTYAARLRGEEPRSVGLGARWEGHLIFQALYEASSINERFIPVILDGCATVDIPDPLQSATHYRISHFLLTDNGYNGLYRRLTDQPRRRAPSVCSIRQLISDDHPFVDAEAAVHLVEDSRNQPDEVARRLSNALMESCDPTERYWIYIALGEIDTEYARETVQRGLEDPDEFARSGARKANQSRGGLL